MSGLTEHQQRHVVATLRHVDALLEKIEGLASERRSPFAQHRPDFESDEARHLRSFVEHARRRMLDALDELGIARPEPSLGSRWSVITMLGFAEIALSELNAQTLRGFGAVDADAVAQVESLTEDLRGLVRRGIALVEGEGSD